MTKQSLTLQSYCPLAVVVYLISSREIPLATRAKLDEGLCDKEVRWIKLRTRRPFWPSFYTLHGGYAKMRVLPTITCVLLTLLQTKCNVFPENGRTVQKQSECLRTYDITLCFYANFAM